MPLPQPRHEVPFEISLVLVRLDHVAHFIINANHGVLRAAVETSRRRLRCWLHLARRTTGDRMTAHQRLDQRRAYLCAGGLAKRARNARRLVAVPG